MIRSRTSLALSSAIVCLAATTAASAEESSTPASAPAAKGAIGMAVAPEGPAPGGQVSFGGGLSTPPPPAAGAWEEKWVPWNTGEEEADMGFAVFGHLGLGSRLNDPAPGIGEIEAANGLRVGVTAIFRPIRYFGVGLGYEHADLNRDRTDLDDLTFRNTYRDLNTLWIDARVYPLRVDPFALYINLAGGPAFQSLDSDGVRIDANSASSSRVDKCSGSGSAGLGLKGAVGAELALISGAVLWADVGPDYYLLEEGVLDGCDIGAGDAFLFGFRAGIAIGFEHTRFRPETVAPKDDDNDGIWNEADACPTVPGVPSSDPTKHGCPLPTDQDGDTIPDAQDACPTEAGPTNADPAKNGCPIVLPKDKDGDTILDDVDACVEIPGVASADPKTNGCPPDTDGDGFRDDQDGCPQEKGADDPDPAKRGCPKLVRVTEKEIIILEQVQFDTAKATIKPASDPLLDSVAQVMKEHPEILKIEVQGHTDNKGANNLNAKLSDNRAKSVREALVKRGIDAGRLVAKGYGPDVPIAPNDTDEGRAKNRRVQFVVTERKPSAPKIVPGMGATPMSAPSATPTPAPAAPATPATPPKPAP